MIDTATTPEQHKQAAEAFAHATEFMADLPFSPDFQQLLLDRDLHADDEDPTGYWLATAEFANRAIRAERSLLPLEKEAHQLIANLPLTIVNAYRLDKHEAGLGKNLKYHMKKDVCAYNNQLKDFVLAHPVSSSELHHQLLGASLALFGDNETELTDFADRSLNERLKGVKHEIGFRRILESFGLKVREATVDEDLKGKDIVLELGDDRIGIDVKASLSEVDVKNGGSDGTPMAVKPSGDIVTFSMLLDKDFAGGFEPSQDSVEAIAPQVAGYLHQKLAERRQIIAK